MVSKNDEARTALRGGWGTRVMCEKVQSYTSGLNRMVIRSQVHDAQNLGN